MLIYSFNSKLSRFGYGTPNIITALAKWSEKLIPSDNEPPTTDNRIAPFLATSEYLSRIYVFYFSSKNTYLLNYRLFALVYYLNYSKKV